MVHTSFLLPTLATTWTRTASHMSNPNRGGPRGRGRGRGGFRGGRGGGARPPGAGVSGGAVFGGHLSVSYRLSSNYVNALLQTLNTIRPIAVFGAPPSIDQRLSPNNVNALLQTLKTIPHDPARPTRPDFGTLGESGVLRVNFFPVRFPKDGVMYDYHVEITPKTILKNIRARLFTLLEQSTHPGWHEYVPFIAHDGSARLVSSKKLPEPLDVPVLFLKEGQVTPTERGKTYTLSIMFTQELPTSQLDALINANPDSRNYDFAPLVGAYNLVLQHHASHNGVRVGKNRYFFPSDGRPLELSMGVEAWRGFFMSARPVYKELMVNVGVCMTAFYKAGNLADAMMEFQRQSKGAMLQRFAQKLKVTTSHLGYRQTKPLRAIASTNAKQTSFQCDEFNAKLSVADYFKKKYNKTLRYPELPVVILAGPNSKHPIYVPPELCEILPGQPFRGKLDDQQTTEMLRFACKRPPENARAILNQGFPLLGLTPNNQTLSNFGLEVSNNMACVPFRELLPPNVSYKGGQPPRVNNGSWNILDVQFCVSGVVKSWWILVVADPQAVFNGPNDPQLIGLWKGFAGKCQRSGMTGIDPGKPPTLLPVKLVNPATDPARQRSLAIIRSTIRDNQARLGTPSFMLVILSKRDNYIYPGIKRICDVELGIHTIHMLANKVLADPRKQDQYFSNVALKVNTKLGGVNHKVDDGNMKWLTKTKTMLVGIDVTHPEPGSIEGTPSIAAVVASVDNNFAQFPASLRCQKPKKEMVTDLSEMMIERLKRYQEVSKTLPDRIYVFREGVSEGQFDTILEEELPKLLDAIKRVNLKKPYRPQLTIVICGKCHHVRNWPADASADKNGNTRPGTVVDQGITAVFDFDFYLQAHAGSQGHVKPTHYTVIYDESRVGVDEMQQGINTASYLYARATRSVSLIPPAHYADLACKRGRCYLNDFLVFESMTTTSPKVDKEEEKERMYQAAIRAWGNGVHPNLAGSMFYI
ncbi:Piwi domain-containing protein [Boletus edulis]|nr:Piwi domain-containing protein [Boletus edulis]